MPQQRQQPRAAVQVGEEMIEQHQRGVGVVGARQLLQQDRQQRFEMAARHFAPERTMTAGQPVANNVGRFQRRAKAELPQTIQRLVVVGVSRKRQFRLVGAGGFFEQARIVALHLVEVLEQDLGEGVAACVAEKACKPIELRALGRQRLRLLVIDHLQPVLDRAQENVGGFHIVARVFVDPAILRQPVEGGQRIAVAQGGIASARNQLLGLREKFDLANAATAKLDVVTFHRDLAVAAIGIDLPLHGVDVGNGDEVEIFAPYEGRQTIEDRLARRDVAGAGARLDHRGALPVLPHAFVIRQRRCGRDGDCGRGRIGPQPQIGAEHVAVGIAFLQQLHQPLRDAHEQRGRRGVLRHGRRRCVVENDEIDVARVVELVGAHLAHGQHDVAAAVLRARFVFRRQSPVARGLGQREADRGIDRSVGQVRQCPGRPHYRPDAADVGERDQQRRFRFHAAQPPHRLRLVLGRRHRAAGVSE